MFKFYESTRTKHSGRTVANLYLQLKWDLIDYENHKYNVKNAKPQLENQAPRTFSHLYCKPKKLQLELERFAKIQRGNKSLMRRIATIQRDGAWIENKNFYEIKSLNTWKRQQEMIDLCYENQVTIARLLDVRAVHNTNKYEDEYLEFKKHKVNVQRYSKDWRHGVLQMKLMQKHIRAMVKAYRTGKYKPKMMNRMQQLALLKEANQQLRREKEAKAEKEAEEQRLAKRQAETKLAKEQKLHEHQRKALTQGWKEARAERLRRIEQQEEAEEKQLADEKRRQEEAKKKRTILAKEKIKQWKALQEEEEQREEEKEKQLAEEKRCQEEARKKRNIVAKEKIEQWKALQEEEEQRELEKKRSKEVRRKREEQAKARAAQKTKKKLAQWKDKKMGKIVEEDGSSSETSWKTESESLVTSILDNLEEQEEGIPREQEEVIPEEFEEDNLQGYDWKVAGEETEDARLGEGRSDEPPEESEEGK